MRSVLFGLVALSVISVALPSEAETTVESVVSACTPAPSVEEGVPSSSKFGRRPPKRLVEVPLPDLPGILPRSDVALALPSVYLRNARPVTIEATRVAQNGGGGTSSGVSSACSAAIAAYVAELKAVPGATTAVVEAGLSNLVYKLATTSIPNGGGSAIGAAILLVASNSTNGNLKYNAQKLADDVKDGKLDTKPSSSDGLTSASLN